VNSVQNQRGMRQVLRAAFACGVCALSLAVVVLAVSGCGSSGVSTTDNGGTVILSVARQYAPVDNWDPAIHALDSACHGQCYEGLTYYDDKTKKVLPLLATEWTSSDAGKTWTFKLREGVTFHDGTPLNSEAVKFSIERTVKIGQGAAYIWAPLKSIETPSPNTVVFHMSSAQPVDIIASAAMGAWIYSPTAVKTHGEKWFAQGNECGTGPYRLKSQKMGTEAVFEQYPEYWGGWEGKHVDLGVIRYIPEPSSRRQMIEAGDVDITTEVPIDDLPSLEKNPDLKLLIRPSYVNMYATLNVKKPPMDNPLVRKAMAYAFPYEDAISATRGGYATQSTGPIVKGLWGFEEQSKTATVYKYDLEKARELLAQAGYPDGGLELICVLFAGEETASKVAQMHQQELAKIGVKMTIRSLPTGAFYEQLRSDNPPQHLGWSKWWPAWPTPYDALYNIYHTQEPPFFNFDYCSIPELDKLMDDGNTKSATDQDAAAADFAAATKIITEDPLGVWAYDEESIAVANKSVQGFDGFNAAYSMQVPFYKVWKE